MVTTRSGFFFPALPSSPSLGRKIGRNLSFISSTRKGDSSDDSESQRLPSFALRVPNPALARSAVVVIGLGFIDAGYSGDWSRIGVISKDTEELLRLAAFVVVPSCLFVIFSITRESK